ncbi:translation initiation factor IF-2 [Helicobacter heilmannii]|uniref:Translation initiation factor IF-2 n=4 Tax=Helicobacter heilmannii TaxID=35817 RepID=A0A0K2Y6G0_HELHE|nr:translation initiation factor IF-2 [Helicobacter heilmannii]CRI33677.1 Translation initiation factor 2 [Helicobacter heilmannii]
MSDITLKDFALELGRTDVKMVIEEAKEMGLSLKTNSKLDAETAGKLYDFITNKNAPRAPKVAPKQEAAKEENTPKKEPAKAAPKKPQVQKKRSIEIVSTGEKPKPTPRSATPKDAPKKVQAEAKVEPKAEKVEILEKIETLEPKAPEATPTPPPPPTTEPLLRRTRGIRIVKRTDQEEATLARAAARASALSTKPKEQIKPKKSTKPAKSTAKPGAKSRAHKLDFSQDRGFNDLYEDEQDEVMLFDFHVKDLEEEEAPEEATPRPLADRVKIQRKNPWMSEGGIRRSTKKRRVYRPDNTQKGVQGSITISEEVRVYEFAESANLNLADVIKTLFSLGMMVTKNDFLDRDAIEILAAEFGLEVVMESTQVFVEEATQAEASEEDLSERAPVVTIMGHVDHGKTSLLDKIRNQRVAGSEAGGITQHIGAYMVQKGGKEIAFIDTPGHEAFSQMRKRGAQVTDIAIIVIAADDGVKPQTIEALKQAKEAGVQIIVAMNKIDKENANVDKLKAECAELGFNPRDWGGEHEFIPISAKTGEGIDNLLETILIQAEIMELKASPSATAKAVVLEGSVEKGRGAVATVIVQNGTLKVGDPVVADVAFGKVRAMTDDQGKVIKALGPSHVALITGLSEVPMAGSVLVVVDSENTARSLAHKKATYLRQKALSKSTKVHLDELASMVANKELQNIPIVLKADTQGSLEAIKHSLLALNNEEVSLQVIGAGVGSISENDLSLVANNHHALVLGFNIRPTGNVRIKAKELCVEIKTYSVIYALIDDMKALVSGLMSPVVEEEDTGQAEVRETFVIPKVGTIAGCMVVDGVINKGIKVRLIRDGVVVHVGKIVSLKRFKDDVSEVSKGYECGIMLDHYNDVRVGDVFESFKEIHKTRVL